MTMNDPVEAFRTQLLEGIARLRAFSGTVPEREYDRVVAFVLALPAPSPVALPPPTCGETNIGTYSSKRIG